MKRVIDYIIDQKAKGNSFQEMNYSMKLMLKGIPVKQITEETKFNEMIFERIVKAAKELDVELPEEFFKPEQP